MNPRETARDRLNAHRAAQVLERRCEEEQALRLKEAASARRQDERRAAIQRERDAAAEFERQREAQSARKRIDAGPEEERQPGRQQAVEENKRDHPVPTTAASRKRPEDRPAPARRNMAEREKREEELRAALERRKQRQEIRAVRLREPEPRTTADVEPKKQHQEPDRQVWPDQRPDRPNLPPGEGRRGSVTDHEEIQAAMLARKGRREERRKVQTLGPRDPRPPARTAPARRASAERKTPRDEDARVVLTAQQRRQEALAQQDVAPRPVPEEQTRIIAVRARKPRIQAEAENRPARQPEPLLPRSRESAPAKKEEKMRAANLATKQRREDVALAGAVARLKRDQEAREAAPRRENDREEQSLQTEAAVTGKKEQRQSAALDRRQQTESFAKVRAERRELRRRRREDQLATAEEAVAKPRTLVTHETPPNIDIEPEHPQDSLLQLGTQGSFIIDAASNAVNLRGVTVAGFDTVAPGDAQTFPEALGLDDANLSQIIGLWGANVVRLTFVAQTLLSGAESLSASEMLAGLDETIVAITTAGAYVLLALVPAEGAAPPAPDDDSFQVWQLLAQHYREEPGVLYEIFASGEPLGDTWTDAAARLVGAIREKHTASVIFVGSGRGGVDVTGLPLRFSTGEPIFNLVYTINVAAGSAPDPNDGQLRALAEAYPLFAAGWRDGEDGVDRLSEYVANLFERYGIGWAASNWNAEPRLVADAVQHDVTPTGWGATVRWAMKLSIRPLLQAFRNLGRTSR